MATWKTLMLQDSASPLMEQLTFFHDYVLVILIIITILVGQVLISLMYNKLSHRFLLEGQITEIIWTMLPAGILILIAMPSLRLLYILDEVYNPLISIKIIGHQWYWSYEYSDYKKIEFDSYMLPSNELKLSDFRLLDTNNHMIIPFNSHIRIIVTSSDVIHSWTMPTLSVKIDGTPGRLNQSSFNINRTGLYFGQCSEICGANHSFMPIVIESISCKTFLSWIKSPN